MEHNTKIKIVFVTLMGISMIIGLAGLIDTLQSKQIITFENINPMITGFLFIPLIKFVGLHFLN